MRLPAQNKRPRATTAEVLAPRFVVREERLLRHLGTACFPGGVVFEPQHLEPAVAKGLGRSVLDNAVSESSVATLKCELVHGSCFPNREAARSAVFEYLKAFYNRRRLHSSLGYVSPQGYEDLMAKEVRLLWRSEKASTERCKWGPSITGTVLHAKAIKRYQRRYLLVIRSSWRRLWEPVRRVIGSPGPNQCR